MILLFDVLITVAFILSSYLDWRSNTFDFSNILLIFVSFIAIILDILRFTTNSFYIFAIILSTFFYIYISYKYRLCRSTN